MPEQRYPTLEEFWQRLDARGVEPDLRDELRNRSQREGGGTPRLGTAVGSVAVAVAARLVPSRAVPPQALAAFLDWSFDRQLGRGDEQAGVLPTPELIPAGLEALEREARGRHGRRFADLEAEQQDVLLAAAERGELPADTGLDWGVWFKRTRGKLLLGYGSDPRGMAEMGFPGPSYRTGHIWLDRGEIQARARRRRGYLTL